MESGNHPSLLSPWSRGTGGPQSLHMENLEARYTKNKFKKNQEMCPIIRRGAGKDLELPGSVSCHWPSTYF